MRLIGLPYEARLAKAGQPPFLLSAMYLLYLDESGNPDEPADKHFVLGGVAVFERTTFFLSQDVDFVQQKHFPGLPPIEFHAAHIRNGKGFWRGIDKQTKSAVLQDLAQVIARANHPGVTLFQLWWKRTPPSMEKMLSNMLPPRFANGLINFWRVAGRNTMTPNVAYWFSLKVITNRERKFGFEDFANLEHSGEFSKI